MYSFSFKAQFLARGIEAKLRERNRTLKEGKSKIVYTIYFFDKVSMIKLEDEIIIVCEFKIIDWSHKHDLSDSELLNPVLIAFDSQKISLILFL